MSLGAKFRVLPDHFRAFLLGMRGCECGRGVRVGPGCSLQGPGSVVFGDRVHLERNVFLKCVSDVAVLTVGRRVFIGNGVEFDLSMACFVGDDVLIAPGVFVTDHHHRIHGPGLVAELGVEEAPVRIEEGAWLGARCVVLKGVRIGEGAVVAAGAVVTRSVEDREIVGGVPARRIGTRGVADLELPAPSAGSSSGV